MPERHVTTVAAASEAPGGRPGVFPGALGPPVTRAHGIEHQVRESVHYVHLVTEMYQVVDVGIIHMGTMVMNYQATKKSRTGAIERSRSPLLTGRVGTVVESPAHRVAAGSESGIHHSVVL